MASRTYEPKSAEGPRQHFVPGRQFSQLPADAGQRLAFLHTELASARNLLQRKDGELTAAIESIKDTFRSEFLSTVDRHRSELRETSHSVSPVPTLLSSTLIQGNIVRAIPCDGPLPPEDPERGRLIARQKSQILAMVDEYNRRVNQIKVSAANDMLPLQEKITFVLAELASVNHAEDELPVVIPPPPLATVDRYGQSVNTPAPRRRSDVGGRCDTCFFRLIE
jgi:hypothetical protein